MPDMKPFTARELTLMHEAVCTKLRLARDPNRIAEWRHVAKRIDYALFLSEREALPGLEVRNAQE